MQKIMYTYRHISQGFAANWTGVVTASVCLTEIDKVGNQISTTDRKDIYQQKVQGKWNEKKSLRDKET